MSKWITCIALLLAGSATNAQERWDSVYEPQVFDGLPCRVMAPLEFDEKTRYPVIVSLHGAGGRGTGNKKQLKDWNRQLAEKKRRQDFPCYVVAPQANELWNAKHLKKIKALIKKLPSVDTDRIYILGHSMGGHGTYIFIQLDTDYFAAAAPSAGSGLPQTKDFIDAAKITDIPIWALHGDKDKVCPYEKDQKVFSDLKRLGGNMKLTTFAGDKHNISGKMIVGADNGTTEFSSERCDKETHFMKWLFSQRLSDRKPQPASKLSTAFTLRDGDRVVFLGNSFFERALEFGHLETTLTLRWPKQNVTFRNLGWDGDTVCGHARAGGRRRAVFGDAAEGFQRMVAHLKSLKPTVIFVAYGLNESFDGEKGIERFREGLKRLTGELPSSIRYVFISPIPIEHHVTGDLKSNLETQLIEHARTRNQLLGKYCEAIHDFADTQGHRYVDLFQMMMSENITVTFDGLHPDAGGYPIFAKAIAADLGMPNPKVELGTKAAEELRSAIVRKNTLYFHRWRPRNDAFVYGERKSEQVIAQQEPEQFEPFIAEQEKQIREMVGAMGGAK